MGEKGEGQPLRKTTTRSSGDRGQGSPKGISRRKFLGRVGAAVAFGLGIQGVRQSESDIGRGIDAANRAVRGFLDKGADKTTPVQKPMINKKESEEFYPNDGLPHPEFEMLIGSDLTESEKQEALDEFNAAYERLGTMTAIDIREMRRYSQIIRDQANNYGIPENLLFGLIIAESRGDRRIFNNASRAKGLTQMMTTFARSLVKNEDGSDNQDYKDVIDEIGGFVVNDDYGESDPNDPDDRYKAEKIIPLTAKYLSLAYERWGNWGFTLWEWHMGSGQMWEFVDTFAAEGNLPDINYRDFISSNNISVYNVLKNPDFQELVSQDENWDNTHQYIFNTVVGVDIFKPSSS